MKAYVVTKYTDAEGVHEPGAEVTFDPSEKEGVETLINYGVLSKTPPEPDPKSTAQRSG